MKLKKGSRVEFKLDGQLTYGVVDRGGERQIKVIIDGGDRFVVGHPNSFQPSEHPMPVDAPSAMDKWEVKKYKEHEGREGDKAGFRATILLNGQNVITAVNSGDGGPNDYRASTTLVIDRFAKDAREWAEQFGWKNPNEPESLWIEWYAKYRPYAVTAAKYIGDFRRDMDAMLKLG